MKYDYLVVGAGLFGAAFAQMAKEKGKRVLVIDKRNHIAGSSRQGRPHCFSLYPRTRAS